MIPPTLLGRLAVYTAIVYTMCVPALCRKAPSPQNFVTTDATTSTISLSWGPPTLNAGEKMKGYRLSYMAVGDSKMKKINLLKSITSYTMEDLAEGTRYSFILAAKTADGIGRGTSPALIVETLTTTVVIEPPGIPQFFEVLATGNSIFARWLPPDGDSFSGYVLGIGVLSPDEEEVELGPSEQSYTFTDLEPGVEYRLSLRAYNDGGVSQPSFQNALVEQQMPDAPRSLRTVAGVYTIDVSWGPGDEDIRGFVVGIGMEELEEETLDLNWDETTYTFDQLSPDTLYLISVRAVNENGAGEAATDKVTTDDLQVLSAPIIDSIDATVDTITATWLGTDEPVTGYGITLEGVGSEMLESGVTTHTFTGLTADTEYLLQLTANNFAGPSSPAERLITTESLSPPAKPVFRAVSSTPDSIIIEWQPAKSQDEVLRYDVTLVDVDRQALVPQQTSYTFSDLSANTEYTIELRAYNVVGPSSAAIQTIFTEPMRPLPRPTIESDESTSDTITISWIVPEEPVLSYEIAIQGSDPVTLSAVTSSHTFTGLTPDTEYIIEIRVNNDGGASEFTIERLSTEALSPLPRPNIRSVVVTMDTITVRWGRAVGDVTSYDIALAGSESITLNSGVNTHTFYGLDPDTRYTVELRVNNPGGASSPSRERVTTDPLPTALPPVEELPESVDYSVHNFEADVQGTMVILSWDAPEGDNDETLLGYLLQVDAPSITLSTSLRLHYRQHSYTFRNLEPLVSYYIVLEPIRRDLPVAPQDLSFTTYVSQFVPPRITGTEITSSSTAIVRWLDPTIPPGFQDSRYYMLRYKPTSSDSYLYANIRETEHTIINLIPDTTYQFSVQTILEGVTSGYSLAVLNDTLSETDGQAPRLLTVVQLLLEFPNIIHVTINWLPSLERSDEVSGYNVQYSTQADPGPLDWANLPVEGPVLAATIPGLTTNITATFRIQAFFSTGETLGPFSEEVSFITPYSAAESAQEGDCDTELSSVTRRITQTRERGGGVPPLGVPLPFCDDYLSQYACPWPTLVCTCIPRGTSVVAAVPSVKPNPGCDAPSGAPPCKAAYDRVMEAIRQARQAAIPLMGANLPLCRDDGYFDSKQCSGSVCYCVDERGIANGNKSPVWEGASLNCS